MIYTVGLFISCAKLLLLPSYHSTDFEVHRNWLAITHSLPVKQWYYENTSEWTLDYPPLFAWFEFLLSHIAKYFDPDMLVVQNLNYASYSTKLFQRLSVIVTDFIFIYGAQQCSVSLKRVWRTEVVLPLLLVTNAGLLMLDHIHFQYNGMLFGFLLMSIAKMMQGKFLQGAFWFAVLLNFKHIFLYMAPAYFVYLLRAYCFSITRKNGKIQSVSFSFTRILKLGLIVMSIFAISFGPFYDQMKQVVSRLFPFKRGLCHAYWAPNVWALYNIADKGLTVSGKIIGLNVTSSVATMTGGLVQEFSYTILPTVTPLATMICTVVAMIPALVKLWQLGPQAHHFVRCLVLCALTSFLFGWHVHEKAILMSIIPLSILAVTEAGDAKVFLLLSTVGHYSLFPLLFPPSLLAMKVLLLLTYTIYAFQSLSSLCPLLIGKCTLPLLNYGESLYVLGLIPLFIYDNVIHNGLGLNKSLPFLPLMLTSVYCSVGVIYCWLRYYVYFIRKNNLYVEKK